VATQDPASLLNVDSLIINSDSKTGKVTFLSYLVKSLYQSKAIIFTPQEEYLFDRRIASLANRFPLFANLEDSYTPYFLKEEWHTLKQKYGYAFLLRELEHIIATSEEKIIVFHRVGEYFEFQDRYEIESFYKSLVKTTSLHNKRIIFMLNNQNENFDFIFNVAEEFSDVSISITSNDNHERLLNIKDMVHNQEHPLLNFRINGDIFLLDYHNKTREISEEKVKNVLIAEIDQAHDNMKDICSFIFKKPNFNVRYADSLHTILQEIFISPDVIIVLMKRNKHNFETIAAIKKQLPNSSIVGILYQNFVRTEDIQEAYNNGCDQLFANNLSLENLIVTLQKSSQTLFYTKTLNSLPKLNNIITNKEDFLKLANACIEKSVFFTAFIMESKSKFEKIRSTSRNSDYVYQTDNKIYYLAISTMPKDVKHITKNFEKMHSDLQVTSMWEPINHTSFEGFLL